MEKQKIKQHLPFNIPDTIFYFFLEFRVLIFRGLYDRKTDSLRTHH
jgi:hypothetical protein